MSCCVGLSFVNGIAVSIDVKGPIEVGTLWWHAALTL